MTTIENPTPPPAAVRHRPVEIGPDTFVIQAAMGAPGAPQVVHMNSMVIRAAEPVVVDTGCAVHRDTYLEDLFSLVDPADVRWVFITHDDSDHYGNLAAVLEACPQATVVGTWFLGERLAAEGLVPPPTRWRWVADGETFTAGDRTLAAVRPPLYDSPTTRGLFDPTTGVYWASDCFATPVPRPMPFVEELDAEAWAGGFTTFQAWNSPWAAMVDRDRYAAECARLEALGVTAIATAHGPTVARGQVGRAFELLRSVPDVEAPPQPGQPLLDEIIRGMAGGA